MFKMILRCFCCSVFLCLVFGPAVKSQVIVDDQGYQNVLISFSANIPSKDGKEIIEKIKELLENTSKVLDKAAGIPIRSATFLFPSSWTADSWGDITVTPASVNQTGAKPDLRVDATKHSPFGKLPVTLQYGGCGVPGHQITLPLEFLKVAETVSKGKILAREWLKYRYGVFEENGYPGDLFYPDYYRIPGGTEIRIPDCTNSKVKYIFKKPDPGDTRVCKMDSVAGDYGYCRAHPDEESVAKVTSSVMYFHKDLINMENICGKDGRPHNSASRNKQNALCDGRSVWDVIKSSKDFETIRHKSTPKSIQFSYIQEPKHRFVVLLENSDNLEEKVQGIIPNVIKFALRQFYYNLPPHSKLGIYTFNSDVSEVVPLKELPDKERNDLGAIADFASPAESICTSCALEKAAQTLLQDSAIEKSSILLITASPLDKIPRLSQKLKESGTCLHVQRFTGEDNPADQTYSPLENSFQCFSQSALDDSSDFVSIYYKLSRFLQLPVQEFNDNYETKTVEVEGISAQIPVVIPKDATAERYTLWVGKALGSASIECKAGKYPVELHPALTGTDITSFTFAPWDTDVTCKLSSSKLPRILAQVGMKTQKKQDINFDIWIHDASTNKEQLPIIVYAKIYFEGYPVKYANVTMVVKSVKNPKNIEIVKMIDNGHGDPDITDSDGIYSGYFSNFLTAGKYLISVKIDDNDEETRIGKEMKSLYNATYTCCGSKVASEDYNLEVPTFKKEKHIVYEAKNKSPKDGYPPTKIRDLFAIIFPLQKRITLVWLAPGGGKAARYSLKLFLNREDAISRFDTTGRDLNTSEIMQADSGTSFRFNIPFKDYDENVTYYAAVRSWNEFNKPSEVSNVVEFIIPIPYDKISTTPESTTDFETTTTDQPKDSSGKTIGIVLGVLGGIAVLCILACLGHYYFVKKPRRN